MPRVAVACFSSNVDGLITSCSSGDVRLKPRRNEVVSHAYDRNVNLKYRSLWRTTNGSGRPRLMTALAVAKGSRELH